MKQLKQYLLKLGLLFLALWLCLSLLLVVPLRWFNPPITMMMAERWLHASDDAFVLKQTWLSWEQLPKQAVMAVVTSEDQRFPMHVGFDFDSIINALQAHSNGKSMRGASTISQQVAKNTFLWSARSWLRKGLEVWFTSLIELILPKKRILEIYMNIAEWGEGVFGIEAASQYHFKKQARYLTAKESALLASVLPNPIRFSPTKPAKHIQQRAEWNLIQQQKLGGEAWLKSLN
jgi:monofunctional biosynthetic peptidoglycan transglycosylase